MLTDQIDWTNPEGDQVRIDINRPLPLSGPPGHVTVQTQFFFNHDLDYLRYGSKGSRQALSISKIKAARYHDFGLELLKHEHMWIDDLDQVARADHQEYTIAEKDFKNLYPSDFEDLNLLLLQGHLNHLPGSDIRMLLLLLNCGHQILSNSTSGLKTSKLGLESYQKTDDCTKLNGMHRDHAFNELYTSSVMVTLTNIWKHWIIELWSTRLSLNTVDIEKVAVRSSLRSLKPKRTIESRAKRSSINLIRTLFHITCSSHNVKTRIIIRVLRIILVVLPEHPSDTYVFTMKMEILLEPTSSKLMVGDSDVHTLEDPTLILEIMSRRFFLRLNLPDHRSVLTGSGGSSKDRDGDTLFQWSLFHNRMLILDRYI
ncbi:hypothetical protein Tco_0850836 [Tanacetum coccineum]